MNSSKNTSAGKWSVALAVIPIGITFLLALLFGLPILTGQAHGEAAWGPMMALYGILHFGSYILTVTSLLGIVFGLFAVYKTKWQNGVAGVLLNISVLILAGSYLVIFYHKKAIDPDRLPVAASRGDYKTVEKLVDKGFDINYKSPYGEGGTALSNAAGRGHDQIVEALLSRGADVNIADPLGRAARTGKLKIVKLLLEHGANSNYLHDAVRGRHEEVVKLLLEYKADINHKDKNGTTPLHDVVASSEEMVKLLISNGADVNARNKRGETPLHILVGRWPHNDWPDGYRKRVIEALLAAGADIEAKTNKGQTPLSVAAEAAKSNDAVKVLYENGADLANVKDLHLRFTAVPVSMDKKDALKWVQANTEDINAKNIRGESILHTAVKGGNKSLVEVLLDMKIAVNVQDNIGDTPLHWAMKDPNIEIIQMFLSHKADVNIQNKKGQTPLHVLTKSRTRAEGNLPYQIRIKACELLLANGANVNIKDTGGKSPLEWQRCLLPYTESGLQYQKELIQLMQKYQNKPPMEN